MARRKDNGGEADFQQLERLLGHAFARPERLRLALTHRSFVFDSGGKPSDQADPSQDNEQLEFMGDAALGLIVAEILCERFPASREGELTKMRAALVSRKHLGEVGTRLGLGRWLRLGITTDEAGGRGNAALVSNAMEATIAALYLDGGLAVARRFVEREVMDAASGESFEAGVKDDKTALQELVQAQELGRVVYVPVGESGPAHRRVFRMEVRLDGPGSEFGVLAEAEGSTKKLAQKEAARLALGRLRERGFGAEAR
jgi:ribonuclease-3